MASRVLLRCALAMLMLLAAMGAAAGAQGQPTSLLLFVCVARPACMFVARAACMCKQVQMLMRRLLCCSLLFVCAMWQR